MQEAQQVLTLGGGWLIALGAFAALALWLVVSGLWRLRGGRFLNGPLRTLFGFAFGALALALAAIGLNLHTYHRLNYEEPVATVEFQQLGSRHYQALLRTADGRDRVMGIYGDEWQIDARVLKWKGIGAMLGLDPQYRLERFSGRYSSIADEQRASRSVYGLNDLEQGIDVWQFSQEHGRWLPFVDTVYGSAAYMPMRNGVRYQIAITEDGLIARQM